MDGESKAITLQGINHNLTKIGVKDGMCEDLVNLRFKDGSWRPSGDGKHVFSLTDSCGKVYTQLYIHTNVYRHLLGVYDGVLYWIANIDADGVFEAIDAKEISDASEKIFIEQTGNLISIIDSNSSDDSFRYFLFRKDLNDYKKVLNDVNGSPSDRQLYPFGDIHLNLYTNDDDDDMRSKEYIIGDVTAQIAHSKLLTQFEEIENKNLFTRPFVAIAAVELGLDGSFAYASNPVLMCPRSIASTGTSILKSTLTWSGDEYSESFEEVEYGDDYLGKIAYMHNCAGLMKDQSEEHDYNCNNSAAIVNGETIRINHSSTGVFSSGESHSGTHSSGWESKVFGSKLVFSISDTSYLIDNKDIFSAICIFITPEVDIFDMTEEGYKKATGIVSSNAGSYEEGSATYYITNRSYIPNYKKKSDVIYNLTHNNFYLYKRIEISELKRGTYTEILSLDGEENEGLLHSINTGGGSQEKIESESLSRSSYKPQFAYNFNGRLHIANYDSLQFHGYPIEYLNRNSHCVNVVEGGSYLDITNLVDFNDSKSQWSRDILTLYTDDDLERAYAPTIMSVVTLDTSKGIQKVCRYIKAGDCEELEGLDPMLSFPDYRATKMDIFYVYKSSAEYSLKYKEFKLTAHPYLNFAYYINADYKPIKFSDFSVYSDDIQ